VSDMSTRKMAVVWADPFFTRLPEGRIADIVWQTCFECVIGSWSKVRGRLSQIEVAGKDYAVIRKWRE
jgi:hypothetical protein